MTPNAAETLALQALAFVAADDRALQGFQAATGLDGDALRVRAGDRDVLAGVLEFLLNDERRLLLFCQIEGIDPRLPGRAQSVLAGEPHHD
jgi:hypothetical protein